MKTKEEKDKKLKNAQKDKKAKETKKTKAVKEPKKDAKKTANKSKAEKKISKEEKLLKESKTFLKDMKNKKPELFDESQESFPDFAEFYDLPLSYNETAVKLLSQTPTRLFVYWDVKDEDKKHFEDSFGKTFLSDTSPLLLVQNKDTNESFEVPVNDFANSWYINIKDQASNYEVSLIRRYKNDLDNKNFKNIATSNTYISSDKHINLNKSNKIKFRNIKTNEEFFVTKDNTLLRNTAKILGLNEEDFIKFVEDSKKPSTFLTSSSHMEMF